MSGTIVVTALLWLCSSAGAQVNTEKDRLKSAESGLYGQVSLSLKLERGNSELTEFDFQPHLGWQRLRHRLLLVSAFSFVEADQGSIVNDGFSHLRYNYEINNWLVGEAFVQGQYDRAQDLNQRYLLGGGLRFLAIQGPTTLLAVGVAAMHEHERLESGGTSNLIRNSNYVSFNYRANDRFSTTATTYVQPSTKDLKDIRVLAEITFTAWLSKVIGMTSGLNYHYDAQPPMGIKEYDLEITSGFTLTF